MCVCEFVCLRDRERARQRKERVCTHALVSVYERERECGREWMREAL